MKRLAFHPEAQEELEEAVAYYDERSEGLGLELAEEVEEAVRTVWDHPAIGITVEGTIRRWRLPRFPYAVIYDEDANGIYVVAVAHHRQRPGYWARRRLR